MAGRNVMCMCQFTDWLSSLIYYLRGGQHTLHFSIKPLSEFPFVVSLYSGLSWLCWAAQPVVPVQLAISPQWFLHGVWQWQESVRVDLPYSCGA